MVRNSKVFLGCSSEAKAAGIPQKFSDILRHEDANVIPWWLAPELEFADTTAEGLFQAAATYDFALFIITPDDNLEIRGESRKSVRDNVLFEIGLFLGVLGPERVQVVILSSANRQEQVRVPSDLEGRIIMRFTNYDPRNLISTADRACNRLKDAMKKLGPKRFSLPVSYWQFNGADRIISATVAVPTLLENSLHLSGHRVGLVARQLNEKIPFHEDPSIIVGEFRICHLPVDRDLTVSVGNKILLQNIRKGDYLESCLVRVREDYKLSADLTIDQMLRDGADVLSHSRFLIETLPRPR